MTIQAEGKKQRKSKRALIALSCLGILSAYALSSGPAVYLGERRLVSFRAIRIAYAPLLTVAKYSGSYYNYTCWWAEMAHKR